MVYFRIILGWSLKLKVGKSKLQPPEFILLVKKTLLVNLGSHGAATEAKLQG